MVPLLAASVINLCGPPSLPIGKIACGLPFISRGAAFSGRPILQPTRQGAAATQRRSLHFRTSHNAPSTPCSSMRDSAASRAVGFGVPSSLISSAAFLPSSSVAAIVSPRCRAAVSAAIRRVERRCSKSAILSFSTEQVWCASSNRLSLDFRCASASTRTSTRFPFDAVCSPNPSSSGCHPCMMSMSSPSCICGIPRTINDDLTTPCSS